MNDSWVYYDHLTDTYRTKDGTVVAAELADNQQSLLDVLYVSLIREKQREKMRQEE